MALSKISDNPGGAGTAWLKDRDAVALGEPSDRIVAGRLASTFGMPPRSGMFRALSPSRHPGTHPAFQAGMGNGKRMGRAKPTRIQLARLAGPLIALASAPGCWNSCFGGGTWIATRRGRKALRDVQVGDPVLSFDVERGRPCEREVLRVFRHGPQPVGRLALESGEGPARITPNHPVFIERTGEFWRADSLDEERLGREATARGALFWTGDRLERRVFSPFKSGEPGDVEEVFNLQIAETETYFADGLLVHNKSFDDSSTGGHEGLGTGGVIVTGGSGGLGTGGVTVTPGSGGEPAGTAGLGGYGGTIGGQGGLGGAD